MPLPPIHWSLGEMLFLGMVIAGFVAFAVTLIATSSYVALGDRRPAARTVTPATRPSDVAIAHTRRAA